MCRLARRARLQTAGERDEEEGTLARAVVQRKERTRTEDMDTFILNIGVGNGEEGGGRREERKRQIPPGGFYTLVVLLPGCSDPTNRRRKYRGISEETVRVRWREEQSG